MRFLHPLQSSHRKTSDRNFVLRVAVPSIAMLAADQTTSELVTVN